MEIEFSSLISVRRHNYSYALVYYFWLTINILLVPALLATMILFAILGAVGRATESEEKYNSKHVYKDSNWDEHNRYR